ncbi:MAG TPA: amino acid ABC transporter substrate-binding protein [Stellaceae bacterium]|jgi:branched-chain amino acid transport system substrate-binding protein|nr:amino acid ABC transporter substrate-binding protein [Stellaceae bacterium]
MRLHFMLGAVALLATAMPALAAGPPIKIGFSAEETGGGAASGKQFVLTAQIWADQINAKGGLLGRKVELIHYDDQSNPALVPGIYTKLLDVDKVDLVMASGTNFSAAAMPMLMEHQVMVLDTLALAVNDEFHYPRFFQTMPYGPKGKEAITAGYFAAAMTIDPKPKTLAMTGADAEFSKNAMAGAREHAKAAGLQIVYDKNYPPNTIDYSPIVRAIKATSPDLVFVASYPADSAGMLRSVEEQSLTAKMFGGPIIGLQYGAIKSQMGERLNGIVDYELFVHEPTMNFPGVDAFIKEYQARAKEAGTDLLGYYVPPQVYATFQVLQQAVEGTNSIDQQKLAEYMHATTFKTIMGDIKFGADGEWAEPRILTIQYQGVKGHDLDQFANPGVQVILDPPALKTGTLKYPFAGVGK